MKKLLTTVLATAALLSAVGSPVFAAGNPTSLTDSPVTTQGGTVSVDVNYDVTYTQYKKGDPLPSPTDLTQDQLGDNSLDDVKTKTYVKVAATTTNGTVKVNHAYNLNEGQWVNKTTVYDKKAGSADFTITNYSATSQTVKFSFAPVTTIAKAISDESITVPTAFDSAFGTEGHYDVPISYTSATKTKNFTVNFIDNLLASSLKDGTNQSKMGTFTVTVGS